MEDKTIRDLITQIDTLNSQGKHQEMKALNDVLMVQAKKANHCEGICAAYLYEGFIYSYNNQLEEGNESTFKAIEYAQNNDLSYYLMKGYNSLGANYAQMSDYFLSLSNYLLALSIAESKNNFHYRFIINNNMGSLFSWLDEPKMALHYLQNAYHDCLQSKPENFVFENITLNLIEAYATMGNLYEIEILLAQYQKDFTVENQLLMVFLHQLCAAKVYAEKNEYQKAKAYIQECLLSYPIKDDLIFMYRCLLELLDITIKFDDFELSEQLDTYLIDIYKNIVVPPFHYRYAKLKIRYCETFFPYEMEQKVEVYQMYYKESEVYSAQFKNTYVQNLMIALELDRSKLKINSEQEKNMNLQKEIERDVFTNLLNKVYAKKYVNKMMKTTSPSTLQAFIILDIDLFKKVNDNYGHAFGDHIILETAKRLPMCVGDRSIVARFGGDEFFAYIPSMQSIHELISMITNMLEMAKHIRYPNETVAQQTYSIGIYVHRGHHNFDIAFSKADEALYLAKASGRNQAIIFEDNQEMKIIHGE